MSDHEITKMEEGALKAPKSERDLGFFSSPEVVYTIQKVIAEVIGTYFLIFVGCCSVVLNKVGESKGAITFPGIAITWGLSVMVLVYSLGHISGAHFNPAVTVSLAIYRQFPLKHVALYILAQMLGAVLASGTLCLLFDLDEKSFFGTVPAGSNVQSLVFEILASFLLMFVISAVSTDNRAIGELGGIAVGMTIMVDIFMAGPISGASMNPVRSIGPALVMHIYNGLWVYIVGPFVGTFLGSSAYNLIRFTDKPLNELSRNSSFLKSVSRYGESFR